MAEEEVSYASVVFKKQKQSETKAETKDETVYDEVKVRNEAVPDKIGLLSDKDTIRKYRFYQRLACCFGTLCVFLLVTIIVVCVYIVLFHGSMNELKQIKVNQTTLMEENHNLTNLNNKLRADIENNTTHLNILKQNYTELNKMIPVLTAEKQNLTSQNQQLQKLNQELQDEKKNLTVQIENMEKSQNELNVSRAQWSIDAYCLKNEGRKCSSCQDGWSYFSSSCYAYNNVKPAEQKTWEEAQKDCRVKISDLPVVADETEKNNVNSISHPVEGTSTGYWIGLRAVGGKWTWMDGTNLTNQNWVNNQPADEGQCVISVRGRGWSSVKCTDKNAWICEKKALSV